MTLLAGLLGLWLAQAAPTEPPREPTEPQSSLPGAPPGEPSPPPERGFWRRVLGIPGDLSRLFDRVQASVSDQLVLRTEQLDSFFGDERIEDDPRFPLLRLRLRGTWAEKGEFSTRVRTRLRIPLPRAEERLQLVLDTLDGEDDIVGEDVLDDEEDQERFAGLRWGLWLREQSFVSLDVGLRSGFEPRVELSAQRRYRPGSWQIRVREEVFWEEDDGFGETTRLDLDRAVGETAFFRSRSEGEWSEVTRGVELSQSVSLSRAFDPRTAGSFGVGVSAHTRPVWIVDEWAAELRLRRQLHRHWLFLELAPAASFPRERGYEFTPRLTLVLEIRFGGEPGPSGAE